jgi:hypothetical protein
MLNIKYLYIVFKSHFFTQHYDKRRQKVPFQHDVNVVKICEFLCFCNGVIRDPLFWDTMLSQ